MSFLKVKGTKLHLLHSLPLQPPPPPPPPLVPATSSGHLSGEFSGDLQQFRRPVQTLSGGQKQRVAIAGALVEECKVLLLDELTTFLDQTDQIGVIKAVKNTLSSSEDVTALWVTHRLEELEYADGAVYMEDGRVVMHGEVSTIMDSIEVWKASYTDSINA